MKAVSANQFASNAMWKFIDVISRKLISLFIAIILARLIAPEAFGVIALTTVFTTFSDIFILYGFNISLIRKDNVQDIDYSTVTSMSLMFSLILYLLFFIAAPYTAEFYKSPELKSVLRVITIILFFQAIASVIRAKGTREMAFKKMSVSAFFSNVAAGVIGVALAYLGWGVWALVTQQLLASFIDMILIMVMFKWKLSFKFSSSIARQLSRFTFGVLGTSFLDFLGNNIISLVVGKSYSTTDLGYYSRGNMIPETVALNTYNSINSVLLPTLASRKNDLEGMKRVTRKVMALTNYIIFPMMFGLIGISNLLIPLLLTDKWIPSIVFMNFACILYAVNPIRSIGYSVFYAKGESEITVRIEIVRAALMILNLAVFVILLKKPILWMITGNALISLAVAMTTQYWVKKSIGYSFKELFNDIFPTLIMSVIVMVITRVIGLIDLNKLLLIILQIIAGVGFYVLASLITKNANLKLINGYVASMIRKIKVQRT